MHLTQDEIQIILAWWATIEEFGEGDVDPDEEALVKKLHAHAEQAE